MARTCRSETHLWRLAEDQNPDWRCWNGVYVVFNSLSGETHTLDIASGTILRRIMEGPASAQELDSELGRLLRIENIDALSEAVDTILQQLDEIAFIEPYVE